MGEEQKFLPLQNVRAPEAFDFNNPASWKIWKTRFQRFLKISGSENREDAEKIDMLLYSMGGKVEEVMKILNIDETKYEVVLEALDGHFNPKKNVVYERFKFNTLEQREGMSVSDFLGALTTQAETCEFGSLSEELIRDRLVVGLRDKKVSERMLLKAKLTLEEAVNMAQQAEIQVQETKVMWSREEEVTVNRMGKMQQGKVGNRKCWWCGKWETHSKEKCPASKEICHKCKRRGHFARCCRERKINCMDMEKDDFELEVDVKAENLKKKGTVRGHLDPKGGLYVFYNIPYATAPTGPNKFKAPLPPPIFETPFDAIDRSIICPQYGGMMNMREDCLVANVFVPDTATADPRISVLVIVHGGENQNGYGEQEKFRELAKTKKVIVVTFNYRLGVHGFLCLGTEGAPGNAGLKDQVALLRWVNTNIRYFGGNPDDVTLAACSAGSGSVDFLTLSAIAKGLFKKAIVESGFSTSAVGVQMNPIENAKTYAKLLGFNGDDRSSLEDFYKTATFQQLLSRQVTMVNNQAILFGPCVESDIGQERVVLNDPFSTLKQGNNTKIPLMYGFTNMDGALRSSSLDAWKVPINEKFSDFLPAELYFESEDVKEEVAQRVKHLYFGDEPVSQQNIQKYKTYFTDVLFRYPMLRSLSTRAEALGDPIYLLEYSFVDEQIEVFPNTKMQGAGYCQQFIAVMDEDVTDRTEEYKKMKQTLREYWHNFILNGVPSSSDSNLPTWKPAGATRSPRMSMGPVIELKDDDVLDGRAAFWDEIFEKHFSFVAYITKRRTTRRPSNIKTTRATSRPITSAPNTVTSNPGTSATIDTGGFEPITIKTTRTTAYYNTNPMQTTTNTTTSTITEWTTSYPSLIVPNPPGSGVSDSIVISKVIFMVVFLSLYFNYH